jgi:hypothetical protein
MTNEKIKERADLKEFNSYMIEKPVDVFKKVPKYKREDTEKIVKNNIIMARAAYAAEQIEKLNSPLKDKVVIELKRDFRNYYRQLIFNRTRLELINAGNPVDDSGVTVHKYQVEYLIDKLSGELELMRKELDLYGLKESEVLSIE